jgi:putative PIN family toxin of toxin-antitoxin system
LDESSVNILIKTNTDLCRDSKDNYLLSLAINSNADYLITGDNDLLILEGISNTKIIKYIDFDKIYN